ncbi:DUF4279 domain-containing protein [Aequorivita lipolytica]|uniref:DUF4279 domain-containing protein n=1 Tax=Aequorivita lipolytica TaxID=153267 RepID=A0A5C6YK72_9FLAO|nr:DUF4279 domain-containing protein [Aequorivita lipolytica]TXD67735.1 DUF4279 domain-containing protein [Aequorivita lipolytica]SRX54170.1 hypothetical protein AEQU2_03074 [Aequorivita lipolytica]
MKNELIAKAISEIEKPTFGTTKQYLEVHNVEMENGKPKVERVDFESFEETNVVYFPIEDELFFLSVYFSKENNEITNVGTENGNQVVLTAVSENLTFEQLAELTKLNGLSGWSINDDRKIGKGKYTFSRLTFEPIRSRAYDLETKLKLLLTELEKDRNGIKSLAENADVIISVHNQMYISGNKGIHLDVGTINRLDKLNLGIDIDQYIFGNELK